MNTRLLRCLPALAPGTLAWDHFGSLDQLPLYDQDRDSESPPESVVRLRRAVASADGLVIATPEYNYSIPGVLKNAIDWASRPMVSPPLTGKAIVIVAATPARARGYRVIAETSRILNELGNIVVPQPQVVINIAHSVLTDDDQGAPVLTDPEAIRLIRAQLNILADLLTHDLAALMLQSIRTHTARPAPPR